MTEPEILQDAYEQSIRELYKTFFAAFTSALGDEQQEKAAEEHFQAGIAHAKHVRDLALRLLED